MNLCGVYVLIIPDNNSERMNKFAFNISQSSSKNIIKYYKLS